MMVVFRCIPGYWRERSILWIQVACSEAEAQVVDALVEEVELEEQEAQCLHQAQPPTIRLLNRDR